MVETALLDINLILYCLLHRRLPLLHETGNYAVAFVFTLNFLPLLGTSPGWWNWSKAWESVNGVLVPKAAPASTQHSLAPLQTTDSWKYAFVRVRFAFQSPTCVQIGDLVPQTSLVLFEGTRSKLMPACLHGNLGSPCSFHLAPLCSLTLKCTGPSLPLFLEVTLAESSRAGRAELIPNPAEWPFVWAVGSTCAWRMRRSVCPRTFCMLSPSAHLCWGGPPVFYHWGQRCKGGTAAFLELLQDSGWWCARDLLKFRKLSRAAGAEKITTCRGSQPRDIHRSRLSLLIFWGPYGLALPCLSCQEHLWGSCSKATVLPVTCSLWD